MTENSKLLAEAKYRLMEVLNTLEFISHENQGNKFGTWEEVEELSDLLDITYQFLFFMTGKDIKGDYYSYQEFVDLIKESGIDIFNETIVEAYEE